MHQASKIVLDHIEEKLGLNEALMPRFMQNIGNTVSNSIPLLLKELEATDKVKQGEVLLLAGFGVGLSWGGTVINWEKLL
ncbi:MAG: hypothetical protein HQK84_08225 [Nitrospinae bacterium]|nr:hypothetical protein [Nitrospinota bacterium]